MIIKNTARMSNGMMNHGNTKHTKRMANRTIHKFCKMFSTVMGNQTSTAMNRKIFWMLTAKILHSNENKIKYQTLITFIHIS
jgi:hypothetical protein